MLAREGQQYDVVTNAFENLTHSSTLTSTGQLLEYRGTYANQAGDSDPTLFILGMRTRSEDTSLAPGQGATPPEVVTVWKPRYVSPCGWPVHVGVAKYSM